jgi:hypothetical protein
MKRKIYFCLFILAAITFVFLFAEFFHTETSPGESDNCPICLWERNTIAIDKIYLLIIPIIFVLIYQLKTIQIKIPLFCRFYQIKTRAPPSV